MNNYLRPDAFTDGEIIRLAIQFVVSCSATEIKKPRKRHRRLCYITIL